MVKDIYEIAEEQRQLAEEALRARTPLLLEVVRFLGRQKKWWITPIVVSLLLLAILVALGGTAISPFVYTLF